MRISRTLAGVLSAALLGAVPVAVAAAPAQAAEATVASIGASRTLIEYKGDYKPYLEASIKTTSGSGVYDGNVELQASAAGGAFKTIRTVTASGYLSFSDVVPAVNTTYRVVYKGSASYSAAASRNLTVKVARKMRLNGNDRTFVVKGKVSPKYGKKKIVIKVSKKEKRGFKKFKTIKTNKKGQFRIKLPKRRGTFYYRFITKKDKKYVATTYQITASAY